MAGRSHTTRTPHRINQALNRDVLGFLARQTVATQDLRKVIYVSPHGKGYHKVKNPVSEEVYVVADGLGGATMVPDSVAIAASFSGQAGEVIISRPPAGFGGASITHVTVAPNRAPTAAAPDDATYTNLGFCWDGANSQAIIARRRSTVALDEVEFVAVDRADMPHLDASFGTAFLTIDNTTVYAMQMGASSSFYVFHTPSATGLFTITKYSLAGASLAEAAYSGGSGDVGTICANVIGGHLYATEPKAGTAPAGGPPYNDWTRITKRDGADLSLLASVDTPNPSSYDGWTLRYSSLEGIFESGGAPRGYYSHVKQPPGGDDAKFVYQDFSSSLALSGGEVQFPDNPIGGSGSDPSFSGIHSDVGFASGEVLFTAGGALHSRDDDGGGYALVLASYNADSGENFGIQTISGTEVLILGSGYLFTTSILTAGGQELPA